MKKNRHILFLAFLTLLIVSACGEKTVSNKSSSSSSSSSSSGSTTGSGTGSSTSPSSCDGIPRSGVTSCYYKNLPEVALSGPGTTGITYWSSATDLAGTGISSNQFLTDATFSVRMIPSYITDSRNSKQGRKCSQWTASNFTKMKLFVMLRKSGVTVGETGELIATAGSNGNWNYSNTYRFSVPSGATSPFILEVVGVQTNHRCTGTYGSVPTGCTYMDIPVNAAPNPTECVGFKLQMATDETYDLPN